MHRRAGSISQHLEGLHPGPELSGILRPIGTPNHVDADVFPPLRAQAPDPSIFLPYVTEDIAFEEEYEEYLSDLGWSDQYPHAEGTSAWSRLPEFAADIAADISDSESIVSIGELGDDARLKADGDDKDSVPDENMNNWEVCRFFHDLLLGCLLTGSFSVFLAYESEDDGCSHEVACWRTPVEFW